MKSTPTKQLSKHVWDFKKTCQNYEIKWSILKHVSRKQIRNEVLYPLLGRKAANSQLEQSEFVKKKDWK